jgi:hypothetical protein
MFLPSPTYRKKKEIDVHFTICGWGQRAAGGIVWVLTALSDICGVSDNAQVTFSCFLLLLL